MRVVEMQLQCQRCFKALPFVLYWSHSRHGLQGDEHRHDVDECPAFDDVHACFRVF